MRILDLDALAQPAGRVTLYGTTHDVLPLDGASYHLMVQLDREQKRLSGGTASPEDHLAFLEMACRLAHRIVPTLTSEQVARLSDKQIAALLQLGAGQVEAVEALLAERQGNASAPVQSKGRARARSR